MWKVIRGAGDYLEANFPKFKMEKYPGFPDELTFLYAEDILDRFGDMPRQSRETAILHEYPAVFIYGIGWTLEDGCPREMRAADYDDRETETTSGDGRPMHGLNAGILHWNPMTRRRHDDVDWCPSEERHP